MAEEDTLHYYKLNVNHSVSVRLFHGDRDGKILNPTTPTIEVLEKNHKAFKEVNKYAILQGLIKEIDEPQESWETYNSISDEEIPELLKSTNRLKLKKTVENVTSLPILYKILEAANEKGASKAVLSMITERIDEVQPPIEGPVDRGEMQQSYDEGVVAPPRR